MVTTGGILCIPAGLSTVTGIGPVKLGMKVGPEVIVIAPSMCCGLMTISCDVGVTEGGR